LSTRTFDQAVQEALLYRIIHTYLLDFCPCDKLRLFGVYVHVEYSILKVEEIRARTAAPLSINSALCLQVMYQAEDEKEDMFCFPPCFQLLKENIRVSQASSPLL